MNYLEPEHCALHVAKRLTKALREKRRWIGLAVHPTCTNREDAEKMVKGLEGELTQPNLRLMDFMPPAMRTAEQMKAAELHTPSEFGLAILRVDLKAASALRSLLQEEKAIDKHQCMSLTSSGKIRLVRQRLGLPRPQRARK